MPTHALLLETALCTTGMSQRQLASAINQKLRRDDGPRVSQAALSKVLTHDYRLTPDAAMAIHRITGGKVGFFSFFPELSKDLQLRPLKRLGVKQRPAKPLRGKAA